MDVEMEARSLPTAFGSSKEAEPTMHEATNMIAAASNADTESLAPPKAVAQLDSSQPITSFSSLEMKDAVLSSSAVPIMENGVVSAPVNGDHATISSLSSDVEDNLSTRQSQPLDSTIPVSMVTDSITTISTSAPEESSVLPVEAAEATTEANLISEQPIVDIQIEPTPLPEQPISDLRSTSQTEISEQAPLSIVETTTKIVSTPPPTEPTNLPPPITQSSNIMSQTPPTVSGDPAPASLETATAIDVKLPSPPILSPPPGPQVTQVTLPEDQEMQDAPGTASQDASPLPAAASSLPIEESHDLAHAPPAPVAPQASSEDQVMTNPSEQAQAKVAREREDDNDESEPAAKRAKTETDEELAMFKVPDIPTATQSPPATNGTSSAGEDENITPARLAHMKKIISNLKKGNSSANFRTPVDYVTLGIPTYPDIVKEPMDLGTIDTKLKNKEYAGVSDFVKDFNLVVNNCYTFNGRDHVVSQQAAKMEASFRNQIKMLPSANLVEASKEEKKLQKPKVEPMRQAPPRRPSMNAGNARSPSASNNPQTFALGPEGVPLIRRDSNVNDGRAKRAVVPPKRHSDFAGRPKKKKYELELKFCYEVVKELQAIKHWAFAQFFYTPVDPVALNIPTYFQIIKKPMDLNTIQTKLENNAYEKASEFKEDVQLIFKNCYKFNPDGEFVNDCGRKLEEVFNKKWETKDSWISSRQPESEPHSAAEEEDEEDEEESEAEDDSEDDRNDKILQLQKQIEMMSKQMGELTQPKKKKKSTPPMPPKKVKTKGDKKEKSAATKTRKEEPQSKKKSKKVKEEKERFVTYNEKQYISAGIGALPDKQMGEALKLIQQNVPSLKGVEETEIELDIDELPNSVLLKLLRFVEKSGGGPLPPPPASEATYATPAATSGKSKKNKPMGKSEQEAHIAELKGKLETYSGETLSPNAGMSDVSLCAWCLTNALRSAIHRKRHGHQWR
jgi:bromodomain-containing factor 1